METRFDRIYPGSIEVENRLRSRLDEDAVVRLMDSISKIGLQSPITIRWTKDEEDGDRPVLVAGLHRLEAVKRLEIDFIDVAVCADERDARLWEISENLARAELTVQERSEHIAEWVRLTDERNKGASCADIQRGRGQPKGGLNAAVRDLGIDRTEAQRAVKIDSIAPEAKAAAKEAGIDDNQSALLRVAKEANPAAQLAAIRREKEQAEAHKRNRETDRAIALTEAQQFGEWLLARTDIHELPAIISWLEGCKPKDVIATLRREAA